MARLLRELTLRARALRRSATPAEAKLWQLLRGRQLHGAKFRRQQPLGPYVVDFFCEQAALVVELDGAHHFPPPRRDRIRDAWFKAAGLTVLRFPNWQLLTDPQAVLNRIARFLPPPNASPLSHRERGWG